MSRMFSNFANFINFIKFTASINNTIYVSHIILYNQFLNKAKTFHKALNISYNGLDEYCFNLFL